MIRDILEIETKYVDGGLTGMCWIRCKHIPWLLDDPEEASFEDYCYFKDLSNGWCKQKEIAMSAPFNTECQVQLWPSDYYSFIFPGCNIMVVI